jgi:hypothetical protein
MLANQLCLPSHRALRISYSCSHIGGDFAELFEDGSRSSTICWASTSGSERLSDSLRLSSLTQKMLGCSRPGETEIQYPSRSLKLWQGLGPRSQARRVKAKSSGRGATTFSHFRNYENEEMMCEDSSSAILRPQRLRSKN